MLLSFLDVTACKKLWEISSVIYSRFQPELHAHLVILLFCITLYSPIVQQSYN